MRTRSFIVAIITVITIFAALLAAGCGNRATPSSDAEIATASSPSATPVPATPTPLLIPTATSMPPKPSTQPQTEGSLFGTQAETGYLIVVGSVDAPTKQANLSAVLWQERPNDPLMETGPCRIELLDRAGNILVQAWFDPVTDVSISTSTESQSDSIVGPFTVSLPWRTSASTLRLLCQEQVLLSVQRSPTMPKIQITQPLSEASVKGKYPVAWVAADDDGDALQFQVQVRNTDDTWSALTSITHASTFELDTTLLRDGQHHIRILATDGFNVAFASVAITVQNTP